MTDTVAARKIQKSRRERLRREKMKEHLQQLGLIIGSDGIKNDKATIVVTAIQTLKALTSQVRNLQAEHSSLNQESNELSLENKELREENTSLQSSVETLVVHYNQTSSYMFSWTHIDPPAPLEPPFSNSVDLPVPLFPNEEIDDSCNVRTDLELKLPGSTSCKVCPDGCA